MLHNPRNRNSPPDGVGSDGQRRRLYQAGDKNRAVGRVWTKKNPSFYGQKKNPRQQKPCTQQWKSGSCSLAPSTATKKNLLRERRLNWYWALTSCVWVCGWAPWYIWGAKQFFDRERDRERRCRWKREDWGETSAVGPEEAKGTACVRDKEAGTGRMDPLVAELQSCRLPPLTLPLHLLRKRLVLFNRLAV